MTQDKIIPMYRCSGYDTHYTACMDCPKGDLHAHRDCCDANVECQWRRDHPSVRCVKHAATTPLDQFGSITAITPAQRLKETAELCKHCGEPIAIRNPTGKCDHLYWPDNLTDEAKLANGLA